MKKGDNQVVSFVALFNTQEIKQNQYKIPFKMRKYQIVFTTDAFYFQEGKANHFQKARFGQFRMSKSGEMLLVNMIDENFKIL